MSLLDLDRFGVTTTAEDVEFLVGFARSLAGAARESEQEALAGARFTEESLIRWGVTATMLAEQFARKAEMWDRLATELPALVAAGREARDAALVEAMAIAEDEGDSGGKHSTRASTGYRIMDRINDLRTLGLKAAP